MSNYEDKYLGDRRIKVVSDAGETRTGDKLINITFDDGSTVVYSERMLQSDGVVTPNATNATALRSARMFGVTKDILTLLLAYNIEVGEVNFLGQLVATSVNKNLDAAEQHQWGVPYLDQRTMDQIDRVLEAKGERPTLKDVLGAK